MTMNRKQVRKRLKAGLLLFLCFLLCLTSLVSCVMVDPNENAPTGNGAPSATQTSEFSTSTATDAMTATPTDETPTDAPTDVPIGTPTATPTDLPIGTPTATPTDLPIGTPTATPTDLPIGTPTATPTDLPIETPTFTPTARPTAIPTAPPPDTDVPTQAPTEPEIAYGTDEEGRFVNEDGKVIMEISKEELAAIRARYEFGCVPTQSLNWSGFPRSYVIRTGEGVLNSPITYSSGREFTRDDVAYFEIYDGETGELLCSEENEALLMRDGKERLKASFVIYEERECWRFYFYFDQSAGSYRTVLYGHDGEVLNEEFWDLDKLLVATYKYNIFYAHHIELPENYMYACTPWKNEWPYITHRYID